MSKFLKSVFAVAASLALLSGCGGNSEQSTGSGAESSNVEEVISPVSGESSENVENTENAETADNSETTAQPEQPEQSEPEESAPAQTAQTAEAGGSSTETEPTTEGTEMSEDVKYIALTFDDGPNATTTNEVLDMLEKHEIIASFFLIGDNINDESAKSVKRAYDMGCEINNHSRTHSDMTTLTAEEIQAEYEFVDEKVFEITGEHTKFFRPPYISVHQIMFDNIDVPFIAGIGANDWDDRITAEKRTKTILKQAKDGDIILLHDAEGNSMTVEALDTIIPELKAQGYKFVTVSELFKAKGIDPDMEKVYTNVMQQNMYN